VIGEVFGAYGVIILVVALVGLVVPIWAVVDAISRRGAAFTAAGSSKGMWLALISAVYLASIRARVRAVMG